jgi:hypothetical protein
MSKLKNSNKKIATILLTLFIAALAVFNMNIAKSNNGEIILPGNIEQVEALADTEITVTVYYAISYYYTNGQWVITCTITVSVSVCNT